MMDLLPTILHAVDGAEAELSEVDGVSLLDAWQGTSAAPERSLMWTYQGQWAVRRGRYKLVVGRPGGHGPAGVGGAGGVRPGG